MRIPFLAFCSDFENNDPHILTSPRSFDDRMKEIGRKAGAQKTSKKRGGISVHMRWYFVVLECAGESGRAETEHHLVSLVFLEDIGLCSMHFGICAREAWWKDES